MIIEPIVLPIASVDLPILVGYVGPDQILPLTSVFVDRVICMVVAVLLVSPALVQLSNCNMVLLELTTRTGAASPYWATPVVLKESLIFAPTILALFAFLIVIMEVPRAASVGLAAP